MTPDDTPIHAPSNEPERARGRNLSGRTLGDFRVDRILGRGGMGEVYLARQLSLDRSVALKVLKPELVANPTYLARFEKEALSAARLNHPNIVHVYSFGGAAGLKFIAMEYVEGGTVKDRFVKHGVPELLDALAIIRQTAQALAAAAETGLVHRDIKPENLLLTRKGQVKVADFGLCQMVTGESPSLTQEGITLGTPMYMSPEQVQGRELDRRSDLYSLGVTCYQMLAGVPPFQGETPMALALKHVREQPVSLAVHRPDLPASVVAMVMRLMEKDPARRFQSAELLLKELARIRAELAPKSGATAAAGPERPASRSESSAALRHRTQAPPFSIKSLVQSAGSIRLGWKAGVGVLGVSLLAGGLAGLTARAPDVLGSQGPRAARSPGLWMAPWSLIPEAPTARAQYRDAQLWAGDSDRVAAWLAVPGRFPQEAEWADRAYVQLIRTLLRQRDDQGLEALAAELDSTKRSTTRSLAAFAHAAGSALTGRAEEVLSALDQTRFDLLDPSLGALGLEVAQAAMRASGAPSAAISARLDRLRVQAAEAIRLGALARPGLLELD